MTPRVDIDRIALSSELLTLADRFAIESTLWADAGCRAQLEHDARLLATIGRAVLGTADLLKAQAFAHAATTIIANVEGTRRFFGSVLTPPRPKGRLS